MNPILYVETNLLVGAAKGQSWDDFWQAMEQPIQVVIPSVCAMEAESVIESDTKYRDEFQKVIEERHLREIQRDQVFFPSTSSLIRSLEGVIAYSEKYTNTIQLRLQDILKELSQSADWIPCSSQTIERHVYSILPLSPTDKLILIMILEDAANRQGCRMGFLSADKHFAAAEIQEAWDQRSIRHFKNMASALGWLTHPPSA